MFSYYKHAFYYVFSQNPLSLFLNIVVNLYEPLMISILRPLRDRFNTAIDLFKYNGRTDFERFLSKDELHKSIKELQNETVKLKDLKAKYSSAKDLEYLKQIKNDIKDAEELIKIRC